MTSHESVYPVCLVIDGQGYFLLWKDGGDKPDEYVTVKESTSFLVETTAALLLNKAKALGFSIYEQEPEVIDFDKMFKSLSALRSDRHISQYSCQILLMGWNTLEDLARSIHISIDLFDSNVGGILTNAYDKLFYGNNIPSVTPKDKHYVPVFGNDERKYVRLYLRSLWREIVKTSDQFSS